MECYCGYSVTPVWSFCAVCEPEIDTYPLWELVNLASSDQDDLEKN